MTSPDGLPMRRAPGEPAFTFRRVNPSNPAEKPEKTMTEQELSQAQDVGEFGGVRWYFSQDHENPGLYYRNDATGEIAWAFDIEHGVAPVIEAPPAPAGPALDTGRAPCRVRGGGGPRPVPCSPMERPDD